MILKPGIVRNSCQAAELTSLSGFPAFIAVLKDLTLDLRHLASTFLRTSWHLALEKSSEWHFGDTKEVASAVATAFTCHRPSALRFA